MTYSRRNTYGCSIVLITAVIIGEITSQSQKKKNLFDGKFISHNLPLAISPLLLRDLVENEQFIYKEMKRFYDTYTPEDNYLFLQSSESMRLICSYLTNIEMATEQLPLKLKRNKEDVNDHYGLYKTVWNPLASFLMFQRFVKSLKQIIRNLDATNDAELALQNKVLDIMQHTGWPQEEDLITTISAILRIQHVYDLNTYDVRTEFRTYFISLSVLSRGKILEYEANVNLSVEDCVEIGKQALNESYYALAVEWFELAQSLSLNINYNIILSPHNTTVCNFLDGKTLSHYVQHSQDVHDRNRTLTLDSPLNSMFFASQCGNGVLRVRRRTTILRHWKGGQHPVLNDMNFWGTCSGEIYKSELEKSKLFCWYETEMNHLFRINPLRAELLSISPLQIIQYYDIIGNRMIEKIKQNSTSSLDRSGLVSPDGEVGSVITLLRSSLNTWIDDRNEEEFQSIPKIVQAVSGLDVKRYSSSELLQVAAYATGGHFYAHEDAFYPETEGSRLENVGNRIATIIFYLNDVEKGGRTSFPLAGIASEPIKGSAVLWFNLLRNGEIDTKANHGACPVVIGEKWISTKWIRSDDQMFYPNYKCVPHQNATFMLKINGKDIF